MNVDVGDDSIHGGKTVNSHNAKHVPWAFVILVSAVLCFVLYLCLGSWSRDTDLHVIGLTQGPTPTPHYLPLLEGDVFVTTSGTQLWAIKFWNKPSEYGVREVFALSHGTPVEILQSAWVVNLGRPGCYYYFVRTEGGSTGWVDGSSLTQDLSQPSPEHCFRPPAPTPTLRLRR